MGQLLLGAFYQTDKLKIAMKLRYERKYLVHNSLLPELRQAVLPFVVPDSYAVRPESHPEYTVRSVYYDSFLRESIHEKIEGFRDRKKLRIRTYNESPENNVAFFEIKRKISNRICKNRTHTPFPQMLQLMNGQMPLHQLSEKEEKQEGDLNRFFYNLHRYNMKPMNLVVYDREPYQGKMDQGVRITFDKNIRTQLFPQLTGMFSNARFELPWPDHFILEIKYFESPMPSWAKAIVHHFSLRNEALSKYVEGVLCHSLTYNQ